MNILKNEEIPDTCLYLKFLNRDLFKTIWDIAEELAPVILEQKWQSFYNPYIIYDKEPSCSDGFIIHVFFYFRSIEEKRFADYIIRRHINGVRHLGNCLLADFDSSRPISSKANIKKFHELL